MNPMVPMKRLGTMTEFASFCATCLDDSSRFATAQFFPAPAAGQPEAGADTRRRDVVDTRIPQRAGHRAAENG